MHQNRRAQRRNAGGMGCFPARLRRLGRAVCAALAVVGAVVAPVSAYAQDLPLIRDTEIESLLQDYARPIFKIAGLGSQNIAIRIVRHDAFNAFVVDGRNVFINTGTIMMAKTPNEVIGVIAHETGHIAGGHMAALRERIARDQTKSLLMKILGIGLIVAGGVAGGDAREIGGLGQGVMLGSDDVIMRSILADRRAQESSADQAGLKYLNATRQSGRGMLETFERFANQEYVSDTYKDPFVRTHPVASDRLAQLRELVQKSPYYNERDPPQLQQRHDLVRAKISGYLERPQTVFNRYPQTDNSLPARYARAIARYFQSGIQASLPEAEALIRERPDNPYFLELKGDVLMRSGKSAEAIEPLRRAYRMTKGASLIGVRLAQGLLALEGQQVTDEAIELCRKAVVEDENPQAYRLLGTAYYKRGRLPEADLATAQAHFLEGDVKQAQIFAKRAQVKLKPGSPEWIRADDILKYKTPT